MIRKILTIAIPLLAPTIAYVLYVYFTAKNRESELEGRKLPEWRRWPWIYLVPCGAVLTAISLALLGLPGDADNPGAYIPPHMEDGKIVPGGFQD